MTPEIKFNHEFYILSQSSNTRCKGPDFFLRPMGVGQFMLETCSTNLEEFSFTATC